MNEMITIPENTYQEKPIHIFHPPIPPEQETAFFHYDIVVEANAQATIIESFENTSSEGTYNTTVNVILHKNSQLTYYKKYHDNQNVHFNQLSVKQKENSQFTSHIICINSEKICSNIHVYLEEEHAKCTLNGITLAKNKQQIEHHTIVEHLKPHGTSDEYYKTILNDEAKGIFDGKIIVAPKAIQTNASQSNKTLLLSRKAQMNTNPQLEIFSDDVKCTHGATIGQLNEEALFYLQARGINKEQAQILLVEAFLSDILDRITLPMIKTVSIEKLTTI